MRRFLPILFVLSCWSSAQAETRGLVAVLPLADLGHDTITPAERDGLVDNIRTRAAEALSPLGYTVLTGENTLKILSDNGIDATKACEADCALSAAKELKASFFLSGSIVKIEGKYVVILRMSESSAGAVLSSVSFKSESLLTLMDDFDSKAQDFFDRAMAGAQQGSVQVSQETEAPTPTTVEQQPTRTLPATLDIIARGQNGEDLSGAEVAIDGHVVGTAPLSREVSSGAHLIKVSKDLYLTKSTSLTVKAGDLQKLTFDLKPDFGIVSVRSEPSGAKISIDGLQIGMTPVDELRLKSGAHTLVLEHEEYLPATQSVVVRPGATLSLPVHLVPDFGPLDVSSTPDDAEVSLDGEKVGNTPLHLPRVKTGDHTVEIRAEPLAYEVWRRTVTVHREKGAQPIRAKLVRREAEVLITSQPPGAKVLLDGTEMGETSLKLRLLGGNYQLRVTLPGYAPVQQQLRVEPPDPVHVDLQLNHGGSGPGGRYTLADLGLGYRDVPLPPAYLPEKKEQRVRQDNMTTNVVWGLIYGLGAGSLTYYGVAEASMSSSYSDLTSSSSSSSSSSSATVPAIAGVSVFAAVTVGYVLIKHYTAPESVAMIPDEDAIAENRSRREAWEQQKAEVERYNARVKAKLNQANEALEN